MPTFPGTWAICAVAGVAVLDVLWIRHAGLALPIAQLAAPALPAAGALVATLAAAAIDRRIGRPSPLLNRVGLLLQGLAFLQIAMISIRVLNHASMTSALPWADKRLAGLDAALWLDWHSYFAFVQARPWLVQTLDASYGSLDHLAVCGFLLLVAHRDARRARYFVEIFLVTAIVCTLIGPLFPARGAVATHVGVLTAFDNFPSPPGLYHLEALERLRSDAPGPLDINRLRPGS